MKKWSRCDLLFLFVLLLAFALRVCALNDVGLNNDEEIIIQKYLGLSILDTFHSVLLVDNILSTILSRLSLELLGRSLFALRWHVAVTSVLTLPVMYRLAGSMFDRRVALVSAFLLAISPFQILHTFSIKNYVGNIFFPFLALYCLRQALLTDKRRWWIGFALAVVAGAYMHLFTLLPVGVALLVALVWLGYGAFRGSVAVRSQGRWLLGSVLGAALTLALLYLPAMVQLSSGGGLTEEALLGKPTQKPKEEVSLLGNYLEYSGAMESNRAHYHPLGNRPLAFFAFSGLALAGVVIGLTKGERRQIAVLLAWSLLPFLFLALAQWAIGWVKSRPHYLGALLPVYLMLVGRGLIGLGDLAGRWKAGPWPGSLTSGALLLALALPNFGLDADILRRETMGNWAAVGRYLGSRLSAGDLVLCQAFTHDWKPGDIVDECARDLTYRLKLTAPLLFPVRSTAGVDYQAVSEQSQALGRPGRVWVVLWGADDTSDLASAGSTLQTTFDRYGVAGLLLQADGQTLLDNLIQTFGALRDIGPTDSERFDYLLRLAELEAARGHRQQAQAGLDEALAINPGGDQAGRRIEATRQALALPPLLNDVAHDLKVRLGDQIELTGYGLDRPQAAPGDTVALTLSWQAVSPVPANYTVFVHLRDAANETVLQQDFQPFDGAGPTGSWPVGQRIAETRHLVLPADLPAGRYQFLVGMYDPASMERLPVADDASGENAALLCTLQISP